MHACTARGIRVSNVPQAVNDTTADTTMFLILGALRGFNTALFALRDGRWRGHPPPPLGHDPEGKVLGILGMGGIGRNLKRKAEAFGMRVVYHNRNRLTEELAGGARYVCFEELLATSDVLSLNLPLNVSSPSFFQRPWIGWLMTVLELERHAAYDIDAGVRDDEARRRDCEHGTRRGHRRGGARQGARQRPCLVLRSRRV